jgi:hypothetical protein
MLSGAEDSPKGLVSTARRSPGRCTSAPDIALNCGRSSVIPAVPKFRHVPLLRPTPPIVPDVKAVPWVEQRLTG